jgi:hypothetical protein
MSCLMALNLYELMTVMGAVRAPGASQRLDRCLRVPTSFRHGSHTSGAAQHPRRNAPGGPLGYGIIWELFWRGRPPARTARALRPALTLRSEESEPRAKRGHARAHT